MDYFSENGLDFYLDKDLFQGQHEGYFVDVGVFDGVTDNHTLFFEKHRQWNGICIEANDEMIDVLKENRTSEIVKSCINENAEGVWLSNGRFSGLLPNYDRDRLRVGHLDLSKNITHISSCGSLGEIFLKKNIGEVDLCIISTMGSEICVLNTIDFEKVDISVFVINTGKYKSNYIFLWMQKKGYFLIKYTDKEQIYVKE